MDRNPTNDIPREPLSSLLNRHPGYQPLFHPITGPQSWVDDRKLRRLYLQASSQQWFAPQRIPFDSEVELEPDVRRVWIKFHRIFYTLEKMGLNVIENMMAKAVRKLKSEEASFYLAAQCYDESRHVFSIENYLKKLGAAPQYERKYHVLGQVASLGFYRVENWLFSTLFSENFASCFLRRAKNAKIDPLGAQMCKELLFDESRHIHFLHIVLPNLLERLSLLGRAYVQASQYFIMKFTEVMSRSLDNEGKIVGLDRAALLEEVFENMQRAYEMYGVGRRFLPFPAITKV